MRLEEKDINFLSDKLSEIFKEKIEVADKSITRGEERARSFYDAFVLINSVAKEELDTSIDFEEDDKIRDLEDSINWTTDAFSIAIAERLGIDSTRDDYFNIFYDAIKNNYGFDWMMEKLKYEGVV